MKLTEATQNELIAYQARWAKAKEHCVQGSKQWRKCHKRIRLAARQLAGRF